MRHAFGGNRRGLCWMILCSLTERVSYAQGRTPFFATHSSITGNSSMLLVWYPEFCITSGSRELLLRRPLDFVSAFFLPKLSENIPMLNVGEIWKVSLCRLCAKGKGHYCWEICWDRKNFSSHLNLVCGRDFRGGKFVMS